MIITRTGNKGSFIYIDAKGNAPDKQALAYIKKLVIPPNYNNVSIFYQKVEPKILYQGYDSKGRLQRIYSNSWTKKAAKKKFCELLNFAKKIKSISLESRKQMMSVSHTKKKMVALIIRLVAICYFRIGNRRYQELYGSFGAMNIQKRHIKITGGKLHISFSGKKGVLNTCEICDRSLICEIREILKVRGATDMVFQWLDHGVLIPVRAIDINNWLKSFDTSITSKDFRTYDSNILLIIFLRKLGDPRRMKASVRKKNIVTTLKYVSDKVHNTPAVLKKNYTQGGIVDMYLNKPAAFHRQFFGDAEPRVVFMDYLKKYCKDYFS